MTSAEISVFYDQNCIMHAFVLVIHVRDFQTGRTTAAYSGFVLEQERP